MLPIAAAVILLVPIPAWFVEEFYSRGVYPWLQLGATSVSNLVPIALLDVVILAAVALLVYRIVQFVRAAMSRGVMEASWEALRRTLRAVAVLLLVFFFAWGCHYRRTPLETTIDTTPAVPSIASLQLAVADANALGATLRPNLPPADAMTYDAAAQALSAPMQDALASLKLARLSRPGRPKFSLILTPFFTWTGVDGMIDPFALESIVHPDLLPVERPFVLAHEWAHLSGEADEAEASAVGWLACMHGPAPLAYSASLYLIMEARVALPPDRAQFVTSQLDPGVRSDLDAIAERLKNRRPGMQRAASRVYDSYLRANRVSDGTDSYERAVSLILLPPFRDALSRYQFRRR